MILLSSHRNRQFVISPIPVRAHFWHIDHPTVNQTHQSSPSQLFGTTDTFPLSSRCGISSLVYIIGSGPILSLRRCCLTPVMASSYIVRYTNSVEFV